MIKGMVWLENGLQAKAERKIKIQEKISKSQAHAELLSPGDTLWHRVGEETTDLFSMGKAALL